MLQKQQLPKGSKNYLKMETQDMVNTSGYIDEMKAKNWSETAFIIEKY